jgi:hypothetical protein
MNGYKCITNNASNQGRNLVTGVLGSDCQTGITTAVQHAAVFKPTPAVPAPTLQCYCADGSAISCANQSCASNGRPGPNSVFITVTAQKTNVTSLLPWSVFPTTVNGLTKVRVQ